MRQSWVEWACFLLCLVAYVPLIYLSNQSGLPPLAILPVSTFSCCIASIFFATIFGWRRHLWTDSGARRAAFAAAPATANIVLASPAAYALAGSTVLAALTLMKLGSIAVALPAIVGGVVASRRVKIAAVLCITALVGAAYGKSLWSLAHGGPWLGGVLSTAGLIVAAWYIGHYGVRLAKMAPYKKSKTFFVWEHILAPPIALTILLICFGNVWILEQFGTSNAWLDQIALGFTLWSRKDLWLLGFCSQVVGLTGGWILVSQQVSAAGMMMYRCSALLAGVVLVAFQGFHFQIEQGGALIVPIVLALLAGAQPDKARPT